MKNKLTLALMLFSAMMAATGMAQSAWTSQTTGTTKDLNSIDFYNEDSGLSVGTEGTILRTTNGGETWQTINTGFSETLNGVSYHDSLNATVVGSAGFLARTTDGGQTWTSFTVEGVDADLLSVDMDPSGKGVACGRSQLILWTDNGGLSWRVVRNGWFGVFYSAQMLDSTTAFVYGENSIMNHLIGRITQPGDSLDFTFFYINNNGILTEGKVKDGYYFNPDSCVTVGAIFPGDAVITKNQPWGDNEWDYIYFKEGSTLNSVDFQNDYGVAVGGSYNGASSMILETWDRGSSWTEASLRKPSLFTSVDIIGSAVYVSGQGGKIMKKTVVTGTGDQEVSARLQVFPNPVTDMVTVRFGTGREFTDYQVVDATGNIVRSGKADMNSGNAKFSMGDLPSGFYYVRLTGKTGTSSVKLIKN